MSPSLSHPSLSPEQILKKLGSVPEVSYVSQTRVTCAGGGGALGHPKTWHTISDEGYARCGYCDHVFIYTPNKT